LSILQYKNITRLRKSVTSRKTSLKQSSGPSQPLTQLPGQLRATDNDNSSQLIMP